MTKQCGAIAKMNLNIFIGSIVFKLKLVAGKMIMSKMHLVLIARTLIKVVIPKKNQMTVLDLLLSELHLMIPQLTTNLFLK